MYTHREKCGDHGVKKSVRAENCGGGKGTHYGGGGTQTNRGGLGERTSTQNTPLKKGGRYLHNQRCLTGEYGWQRKPYITGF